MTTRACDDFDPEKIVTRFFKPLEQDAFIALKHVPYLKGPFKGKGAYEQCASQCEQLRNQLIALARDHVLPQFKSYPFALLPVELALQTTGAGTAFLRWRKKDRSVMGVGLWDELMGDRLVSDNLINDLYMMEVQRISLNMQVSIFHSITRRSTECANKIDHAQEIYKKRMMKS